MAEAIYPFPCRSLRIRPMKYPASLAVRAETISSWGRWLMVAGLCFLLVATGESALAQTSAADLDAEAALASPPDPEPLPVGEGVDAQSVSPFSLLSKGGWLMIPILLVSIVVVAIGVERAFGLRRSRLLPEPLVRELGRLAESSVFDPHQAYQLCQRYPSAAARVVQALLLKVGRPHSEVEKSVSDAAQREADSLYWNVRTLHLASSVSPLLGLLGTVWGIIQAFFVTANLPDASNKAEALAQGIYIALITTFAGLMVAIPAAVLAHVFEGKILTLMREVEMLASSLLPQVERYEGKLRLDRTRLEGADATAADVAARAAQSIRPTVTGPHSPTR